MRQILYETPRRTELFIVMTMYNEDEVLFCRTMHGVMSKWILMAIVGNLSSLPIAVNRKHSALVREN